MNSLYTLTYDSSVLSTRQFKAPCTGQPSKCMTPFDGVTVTSMCQFAKCCITVVLRRIRHRWMRRVWITFGPGGGIPPRYWRESLPDTGNPSPIPDSLALSNPVHRLVVTLMAVQQNGVSNYFFYTHIHWSSTGQTLTQFFVTTIVSDENFNKYIIHI